LAEHPADPASQSLSVSTSDVVLLEETQKRLTLNWLIQGAAQHAGMTFHHLVRDELNALDPKLVRLYDQYALINLLQYWQPDSTLILGWPSRFWNEAASKPSHPFFGHPLLSKYGGTLAQIGRQRALARCKEKGFTSIPIAFTVQTMFVIKKLIACELPHRKKLAQLARRAASMVWGIPIERLDGELTEKITLDAGTIPVHSVREALFHACIVGYGGVVHRDGELTVVARGTNWQLLAKELVKGTAELICLHGLNRLSDDTYHLVIDATDRLELEPWMLQSGGELWRRLLASIPENQPVAHVLMGLARLPASELDSIIAEAIERPEDSKSPLKKLGDYFAG
jgi:hypothetical protein